MLEPSRTTTLLLSIAIAGCTQEVGAGVSSSGAHASGNGSAEIATAAATSPAHSAGAAADSGSPARALPPHENACVDDADCGVLAVEIGGDKACCASCRTTAGTRGWAAEVRNECAKIPPVGCYPLACPLGPTRPRCRDRRCIAVP